MIWFELLWQKYYHHITPHCKFMLHVIAFKESSMFLKCCWVTCQILEAVHEQFVLTRSKTVHENFLFWYLHNLKPNTNQSINQNQCLEHIYPYQLISLRSIADLSTRVIWFNQFITSVCTLWLMGPKWVIEMHSWQSLIPHLRSLPLTDGRTRAYRDLPGLTQG